MAKWVTGNQNPWQKRWQERCQSKLKLKFVHGRNYSFAPNHLETLMRPTALYLHLQVTCPTWQSDKNKQGSDTQGNQIQSPVMWNPEHWTRSGHSQLKKPKLTGMRKGTNCFHRWRTLKKKNKPHNSSIAQDGSFLQPHSQKSRRGSRQCSEQPVKNIILCAWLNSFSTHLYSLFIATRDLICLPGIRWGILYHVPDRDQPLQPSQRTAIKIPHC